MLTVLPPGGGFRYDSDNPRVTGDVGMAGVAIDSVEDMKVGGQHEHDRMCTLYPHQFTRLGSAYNFEFAGP